MIGALGSIALFLAPTLAAVNVSLFLARRHIKRAFEAGFEAGREAAMNDQEIRRAVKIGLN